MESKHYIIEEPGYIPITHKKCVVNNYTISDDDNISTVKVEDNYLEADDEASIQSVEVTSTFPIKSNQNIQRNNQIPADIGIEAEEKLIWSPHATFSPPVVQSKPFVDYEETPIKSAVITNTVAEVEQAQPALEFHESTLYSEKDPLFSTPSMRAESMASSTNVYSVKQSPPSSPVKQGSKDVENINGFLNNLKARYNSLPLWHTRYFGLAFLLITYFIFPLFISGFLFGMYVSLILFMLYYVSDPIPPKTDDDKLLKQERLEELSQESAKEDTMQKAFKGWMNILNEPYNISTFHYNDIQPVMVSLEGNVLKISRPEKNMLKHALPDDPTFKEKDLVIISQSIYDLTNAEIKLRPQGLAPNRWFSRRYPICIKIASPDCETHSRDEERFLKLQQDVFKGEHKKSKNPIHKVKKMIKKRKEHRTRRASISSTMTYDSESYAPMRAKGFMRQTSDVGIGYNSDGNDEDDNLSVASNENLVGLQRSLSEGNLVSSPLHRLQRSFPGPNSGASRNIYLFARTAREKERWFHVLRKSCAKYSNKSTIDRLGKIPHLSTNFNRDYYLYLLKEMEFNRLLDGILTSVNDNRSEESGSLFSNSIIRPEENIVIMDLGKQEYNQPAHFATSDFVVVTNLLTAKIFYDLSRDGGWVDLIRQKAQTKIATLHLPHFMDELVLANMDLGSAVPKITKIFSPSVDEWGIWLDVEILYEGSMKMTMETHCDLMKLQTNPDPTYTDPGTDGAHACRMLSMRNTPNAYFDQDVPLSPELSPDEDFGTQIEVKSKQKTGKKTARKLIGVVDRLVHSKVAKKVTSIKKVRKAIEKISDKTITINVDVTYVHGILAVNIPAPPSDRIWYGFRSPPEMKIKTVPQMGDRTMDIPILSDFMESNMMQILARHVVLPNMDDIPIPRITNDPLLDGPINM